VSRRARALILERPRLAIVALHAAFALLFFGAALARGVPRGRLIAGDALFYYAYLPSWVIDHDVDLTNDLEKLRGATGAPLKYQPTVTGKASSPYAIGTALLDLPFFGAGLALDRLAGGRGDGYGWMAQASMCLGGISYACAGTLLLLRLLRRWFDLEVAFAATVGFELASSLVYYVLVSPAYAHAASFFAVTVFVTAWIATRDHLSARDAIVLGAAAGLMTLVRWQDSVFVVVTAVPLVARLCARSIGAEERARILRFAALASVAALVVFSPQLWVWHSIYGSWLTIPQGDTWVRWGQPELAATLVSLDDGGLFTWTPITLLGLAGLWRFREREPALALGAALALALDIYVEATVHHGLGAAYGSRRLVGATALFAMGFAALLDALRSRRPPWAAWLLVGALVSWNGLLLTEYQWLAHAPGRTGPYPTLRELIRHTPFRR